MMKSWLAMKANRRWCRLGSLDCPSLVSVMIIVMLFLSGFELDVRAPLIRSDDQSACNHNTATIRSRGIIAADAARSGKKLRSYLQKKMLEGRQGDPTRPIVRLNVDDTLDILQDTGRKFDVLIFFLNGKDHPIPPEAESFYPEFQFFARQAVSNLKSTNKAQLDQLIFAEMVYNEKTTGAIIQGVGMQSLPSAFFMKRDIGVDIQKSIITPLREKDRFEVPFSFKAEDFAKVLKNSHDIDVGPIVRPSIFDEWWAWPALCLFLMVSAAIGWRVYHSEFIKNPFLWASLTFSVFSIATSGFFFTIIKKTSWAMSVGNANQKSLVYPGRQMQTKTESVFVAGLYLLMTISILCVIMVIPRMKPSIWRYAISYSALAVAFVSGNEYFNLLFSKQSYLNPRIVLSNS